MGFFSDFKDSLKKQLSGVMGLNYLGGHPDLPRQMNNITVIREKDYITILGINKPIVPISTIKKVELQKASKRSVGKAAAGAIVGGVLTGGIGAVAGAALGGRKKDDSLLVVTVEYNGMDIEMVFAGDNISSKYGRFMGLLK